MQTQELREAHEARVQAALAAALRGMERLRAAEAYAGHNPMAHREPPEIDKPGFEGMEQMFAQLASVDLAKYMAGAALVKARLNRALGSHRGAIISLDRAAIWRREAYLRSLSSEGGHAH